MKKKNNFKTGDIIRVDADMAKRVKNIVKEREGIKEGIDHLTGKLRKNTELLWWDVHTRYPGLEKFLLRYDHSRNEISIERELTEEEKMMEKSMR